jgi:hypothetical protein
MTTKFDMLSWNLNQAGGCWGQANVTLASLADACTLGLSLIHAKNDPEWLGPDHLSIWEPTPSQSKKCSLEWLDWVTKAQGGLLNDILT